MNASFPLKNAIPHYYHLFLDNRLCPMSQIAPCSTKYFIDTDGQEEEQASHKRLNLSQQLETGKDLA